MLSIAFIRENPDVLRQALAARQTEAPLDDLLALDGQRRGLLQQVEALRAERNAAGKEIGRLSQTFPFAYPGQVAPPFTILLEDSAEPGQRHQHVDFIYFCRPVDGPPKADPPPDTIVAWVDEETLRANRPVELVGCGVSAPVSEDVRLLALTAIASARSLGS